MLSHGCMALPPHDSVNRIEYEHHHMVESISGPDDMAFAASNNNPPPPPSSATTGTLKQVVNDRYDGVRAGT